MNDDLMPAAERRTTPPLWADTDRALEMVRAMNEDVVPLAERRPTLPLWPDTCKALGVSRSSGYAAVKRGEIPIIRIGARILVPTAWLRRKLLLDEPGEAA